MREKKKCIIKYKIYQTGSPAMDIDRIVGGGINCIQCFLYVLGIPSSAKQHYSYLCSSRKSDRDETI